MKNLIRFFASNHKIAIVFILIVSALGISALIQMRRDMFPDVDLGVVTITTVYPGASPRDVELGVTNRLEEELGEVPELESFESYSMEGLSIITVNIGVDTPDIDARYLDIRDAVDRVVGLPELAEAPLVRRIRAEEVVILVTGVAGEMPYEVLREAAEAYRDRLEEIEGVSRIEGLWYLEREVRVELDLESHIENQVSLEEIAVAIRNRNVRSTAGTFEAYTDARAIVTLSEYTDPGQISETVIRATPEGPLLTVGDVADVSLGFEEPGVLTRINGIPAIVFNVRKVPRADIIRTVDAVRRVAVEFSEELPEGAEIVFTSDLSTYVSNRFNVVVNNGLIGFILVIMILTFFLNRTAAFWVALSIPVVLLGTVFFMQLSEIYFEIVSLTSMLLIVGIIVDDGIIVSENIIKQREAGLDPVDASTEGAYGILKPVFANALTTMLAFSPLLFMGGIMGEFVLSVPLIIIFALLLGLAEVVIALPAHLVSSSERIKTGTSATGRWFGAVHGRYVKIIQTAVRRKYLFIGIFVLVFALSLTYAFGFMRFDLFPDAVADTFFINMETPIGSSLERTSDIVSEMEDLVAALPEEEVDSYLTEIGSQRMRIPGENSRWAYIEVSLTPYARRARTAEEIVDELREASRGIEEIEDIEFHVVAGGPPVGEAVEISVIGDPDPERTALAGAIVELLEGTSGVFDIERNDLHVNEEFVLRPDFQEMARLGVTPESLAGTVRAAYLGTVPTSMRYGDEDVDVRVLLRPEYRMDPAALGSLLTPNPQGRLISIERVAVFEETLEPVFYYHFEGDRTVLITADVDADVITPVEVMNMITQRFGTNAAEYPGVRIEVGGEAEETVESFRNLYIAFGVAVLAIYLLLVLLFNSYTQPFTVIFAIPFGIIAVIIAFVLHGEPVSFMGMMGVVGLSGVVVNSSLVMVNHIDGLALAGAGLSISETVVSGASDRLRAVMMTTLTTSAGLLPLAYGIGGSDPFIAPLALSIGYGILLSAPLTLLLVPCLYAARAGLIERYKADKKA